MSKNIFHLPDYPEPRSIRWGLKYNNNVLVSPITKKSQIIYNEPAQWYGEIILPLLDNASVYKWRCFLLSLEGKINSFYFNIPQNYHKDYKLISSQPAKENANTLTIKSSKNGSIIPGDIFSINYELKVVRSFNNNQINFYPCLRNRAIINSELNFSSPIGIFRMVKDDVSFFINELNNHAISIIFEEDI